MYAVTTPPTQNKSVGGLGCIHCIHWTEYKDDMTYAIHNLGPKTASNKWGKCSATGFARYYNGKEDSQELRLKTRKHILLDNTIYSTSSGFSCPYLRCPKDDDTDNIRED